MFRALMLAGLAWLPHGFAAAQQPWPTRPVTIVVPYAPGGASDALARALAQRLAPQFSQPVVVENRPGGNTLIGAGMVAKAPPDGHTLLLTAEATLAMNPHLYGKLPYQPETSFAPVAALAHVPQGLVVPVASTANTVEQFIAEARQQPGRLSYATLGPGSTAHLNMELFQRTTGVKLTPVPYKGAAPALTDLIGGHVQAMIVSIGLVAPQVRAGKLRLLAVAGDQRSALVPEVPTFSEAGLRGFAPSSWFALMGVAGTPAEVVSRINREVNRFLADQTFKAEVLDKGGLVAIGGSADQLATLIRDDSQRWGSVIRSANIRLD